MGFQSGCCDRASKLRRDLRSWMPLSQVLQLGDIVCRPAAEGGIGHGFLQTTVPTRKIGNSGKVPMAQPKKTRQKWIRRPQCERSLMRPVVKLGIAAGGLTAPRAALCRPIVRTMLSADEYRGVPHDRHFSAS